MKYGNNEAKNSKSFDRSTKTLDHPSGILPFTHSLVLGLLQASVEARSSKSRKQQIFKKVSNPRDIFGFSTSFGGEPSQRNRKERERDGFYRASHCP